MNNTKKNIYIVLLIISIISNMILLYKKISIKNYYKESYLVLQDGKQINIYSIDDSKKQILKKKSSNIQKGFKVQILHQEEENKISLNVGIGTGGTMNDAEI